MCWNENYANEITKLNVSEDKIKTNDVIRAYLEKLSLKVNVHNKSFTWSSHLDETLVLQRDQRTVYTLFNLVQKPKNHVFKFHKIFVHYKIKVAILM